MIWSLVKIILFVCAVAAIALGAGYLLESQGGIQVVVAGTEFTLGPLESVMALVVLVFAVWVLIKVIGALIAVWHFLNGDETAITRYFARNRQAKGFDALAEGMMALASGEGRMAMTKAAKAEKYLKRPELTDLLTAQAAEMSGDRRKAEQSYRKLIQNEQTRFVGVRGIMKQKLAEGDTATAMELAKKAFALKPRHTETGDVLLKLQAQSSDWAGARNTLHTKLKAGALPRDVHKRRDAVLALSEAKQVFEADQTIEAREAAIEANRLSPDLIPAAVMAAQSYIEQGNKKYATRVIKKAWEAMPHPDLAATFAAIEPEEDAAARMKRFQTLTKLHRDHAETRMLLAELHIANEDFPQARRDLGDLFETDPTARVATLLAAIERGEGAPDNVVKGWLTRALTVPRGPQWVCENCLHIHANWQPVCENCESFDTLAWIKPPMAEVAMPGSIGMLPMIVGNPEPQPAPDLTMIEDAELLDPDAPDDPPENQRT
jgi:HemY protein